MVGRASERIRDSTHTGAPLTARGSPDLLRAVATAFPTISALGTLPPACERIARQLFGLAYHITSVIFHAGRRLHMVDIAEMSGIGV